MFLDKTVFYYPVLPGELGTCRRQSTVYCPVEIPEGVLVLFDWKYGHVKTNLDGSVLFVVLLLSVVIPTKTVISLILLCFSYGYWS